MVRRWAKKVTQPLQSRVTTSLYAIQDRQTALRADSLARAGLSVGPSALLAASRIHLLYTFNEHDELAAVCWQITTGSPRLLRNQQVLHMLLKSAWVLGDDALLERVVGALAKTLPTPNNAAFIGLRQGAHPAFALAVDALKHRSLGALYAQRIFQAEDDVELDAAVRTLDLLGAYDVPAELLAFLKESAESAVVHRYLGRMATRRAHWNEAWDLFSRALVLAPSNREIYDDLGDTALYLPGADDKIRLLLQTRDANGVKVSGYDRLLAHQHMLDGNLLEYLLLRDDQVSNKIAASIYGETSATSMGRNAHAFGDDRGAAFVIGRDGVADEVRWSAYYPSLQGHYSSLGISCDPRLASLFRRSFPWASFYPVARNWGRSLWATNGSSRDDVPHLELAGRLDNAAFAASMAADEVMFIEDVATRTLITEHRTAPAVGEPDTLEPVLVPLPDRVSHWQRELTSRMRDPARVKVGIIWRSSLIDLDRERHYLTLADYRPLLGLPVELFSIQHHVNDREVAEGTGMGVHWLHDDIDLYDDFEEIAAVTSCLDLVIGISTLPYEMAAAVGTECWLAAVSPNGRWMRLGRDGERFDLLTRGGSVFHPRGDSAYLAGRSERAADIMEQIHDELQHRLGRVPLGEVSQTG